MRSDIVEKMCRTARPDFDHDRENCSPFARGMDALERVALRQTMGMLYDAHILPSIEAEREACAQVAESHGVEHMKVRFIAADIRSRTAG